MLPTEGKHYDNQNTMHCIRTQSMHMALWLNNFKLVVFITADTCRIMFINYLSVILNFI